VGRLLANVCIACLYGRLIKQHCSRARSQVQALSCVRSKQAGVPAQVKKAQTLTEKILARHSNNASVAPGQNIWTNVDKLMTHDVCGPGTFGIFQREFGENAQVSRPACCLQRPCPYSKDCAECTSVMVAHAVRRAPLRQVWDPEKIVIIPDHYIFTSDPRANRNVDILRYAPHLCPSAAQVLVTRSEPLAAKAVWWGRDMVKQYGIKYFYDITDRSDFRANPDYKGVCHIALAQEGHCKPGARLGAD